MREKNKTKTARVEIISLSDDVHPFCWITVCCLTHHPCGIPLTSSSCSHVLKKVIKRSGTNTHQI